ncbi:MAG: hypothetical protein COT18_08950 [Elusimicrobia bacterium CG08_land_8_20_14_0_20_59_10]|nr:MAG: hypothetical protein COT18_08950 [Elusimicrobia bacterium CG08_land_8_20_14_0_20_59_10]
MGVSQSSAGAIKVDTIIKNSEVRAVRSEVAFQAFKERVFDGIFDVNARGTVLDINTAMAQFLSHDPDFLRGRVLWEQLKCSRGVPDESFLPPGQVRCTLVMTGMMKTGGSVELLVDLFIKRAGGRFDGFRGCARPAERALAFEKIKESAAVELFRALRGRLKSGLEEIESIAGSGKPPAEVSAGLARSANGLQCALASCFDPEVPLKWTPKLRLREVDPRKLLDYLRLKYSFYVQTRAKRLKIECAGEVTRFSGDFDYLEELLTQLAGNALKYTSAGGEVEISYCETAERRSFIVSDNGLGMSQAEVSRIFTPFFRADNEVNSGVGGLGLGLWTAQKIAQAHHGSIFAEAELGKGSTFTFFMPKLSQDALIKWID